MRRSLALILLLAAAPGCGDGSKRVETRAADTTQRSLPACAHAGAPVRSGLPASFPLPAGTVVRSTKEQKILGDTFRIVAALAPGTIQDAVAYIRRLPKAGYRITDADNEEQEAEATFVGRGVQGRLRFRTMPGCAGAMALVIGVTRD